MQLLLTYEIGTCAGCGRPVYFGESHYEVDSEGQTVCAECGGGNNLWYRCRECGRWTTREDSTRIRNRGRVCSECFNYNDFVRCHDCGEWIHVDDACSRGGFDFCEDCVDDWTECDDCGELINMRTDCNYTVRNGETICEHCYDENYFTCERCGEVFSDECRYHIDDEYYCESCAQIVEEEQSKRDGILGYHCFNKYNYLPRFADDSEIMRCSTVPTFGVELECDGGDFDFDSFSKWTDDGNLIHFEHDGSLSDDGVECITMPCSLRFHQEMMDWRGICDEFRLQGFRSHNTDCCGLHVHIGRNALSPVLITKMDVFINRASGFFSQVARRSVFYSSEYDTMKRLSAMKGLGRCDLDRYQAVNTSNPKTVEIRIFRGTLNSDTILGTLEMLHALIRFLNQVPVGRIYDNYQNVRDFIGFCHSNRKEYPHVMDMFFRLIKKGEYLPTVNTYRLRKEEEIKRKEKYERCA